MSEGEDVEAVEASNAFGTKEGSAAEKVVEMNLAEQVKENFSCYICDFALIEKMVWQST